MAYAPTSHAEIHSTTTTLGYKRIRGRPSTLWRDDLDRQQRRCHQAAQDRKLWKDLGKAYSISNKGLSKADDDDDEGETHAMLSFDNKKKTRITSWLSSIPVGCDTHTESQTQGFLESGGEEPGEASETYPLLS